MLADKNRILITDDHLLCWKGCPNEWSARFRSHRFGCGMAIRLLRCMVPSPRHHPDGLRMPGLDGVGRLRRSRPNNRRPVSSFGPPTILTPISCPLSRLGPLALAEGCPREDLFRAIRAAARGDAVLAPAVAARLMTRMRARRRELERPRDWERCSWWPRERATKKSAKPAAHQHGNGQNPPHSYLRQLGVDDGTAAVTTALEKGSLRWHARLPGSRNLRFPQTSWWSRRFVARMQFPLCSRYFDQGVCSVSAVPKNSIVAR